MPAANCRAPSSAAREHTEKGADKLSDDVGHDLRPGKSPKRHMARVMAGLRCPPRGLPSRAADQPGEKQSHGRADDQQL